MSRMPQVTAREVLRFLEKNGFVVARKSGAHVTLTHSSRSDIVTVPVHKGHDLGRGLAVRILKDAGFSVEDFLKRR